MSKKIVLLASWFVLAASVPSPLPKFDKFYHQGGVLYPQESESREVKLLDGMWNFKVPKSKPNEGFEEKFFSKDLTESGPVIPMPVPSSYNDITMEKRVRDYVGFVWYDRTFFVARSWTERRNRVWLRFSSVHYKAYVWINGHEVMKHEIGHLPFHTEITHYIQLDEQNRVTVAVDNRLSDTTIPQGRLSRLVTKEKIETIQNYDFDFFNYAGIHRSVHLYTTPEVYIDDIVVSTDISSSNGSIGLVSYKILIEGPVKVKWPITCNISLMDKEGSLVAQKKHIIKVYELNGTMEVPNVKLWWPYLMHPEPGYLYTLKVNISSNDGINDIYRLKIGIRTLKWDDTTFKINNKPIYMRGFGKHEDSDIRGKGLDLPLIARDYNLIKWFGANAFRTSHYPYAEEIMDMADRSGIMVIDECPAVSLRDFDVSDLLRMRHEESLLELLRRDKNRASVIAWSIANEPSLQREAADYFGPIADLVKETDPTRPITAALLYSDREDYVAQYLDVIGFNSYVAWYETPGHVEVIRDRVVQKAFNWYNRHNKPIFITEYGADAIEGFHNEPANLWSEEYQVQCLSQHFRAFDILRKNSFWVGEMIWAFADFNTAQSLRRPGGNRKGVCSRNRQPKDSAHHLRKRYWSLARSLDKVNLSDDVFEYVSNEGHNCVHSSDSLSTISLQRDGDRHIHFTVTQIVLD